MKKETSYNESDLQDHMGIWLWLENPDGEILMQYHKKFDCWTIPLEKSDPGETLEEVIVRTGEEELGVEIFDYEIMHVQEYKYERDGCHVEVCGNLVRIKSFEGIPKNMEPEKHTDFGWKPKVFIMKLKDSTDAVKALQKYI